MEEIRPFYTSIYIDKLENNFNLYNNIKDVEKTQASASKSNCGGWQSQSCIPSSYPFMNTLLDEVSCRMKVLYKDIGIKRDPACANYWFNVNRKYNYNNTHSHPQSVFSAVFYVKVPSDSGKLYFERSDRMEDWFQVDTINERNYSNYWIEPSDNLLVIFPSYLEHYVTQNLTEEQDGERISIAFNFN